jgi:hypothetical protein
MAAEDSKFQSSNIDTQSGEEKAMSKIGPLGAGGAQRQHVTTQIMECADVDALREIRSAYGFQL